MKLPKLVLTEKEKQGMGWFIAAMIGVPVLMLMSVAGSDQRAERDSKYQEAVKIRNLCEQTTGCTVPD